MTLGLYVTAGYDIQKLGWKSELRVLVGHRVTVSPNSDNFGQTHFARRAKSEFSSLTWHRLLRQLRYL